MTMVIVVVIAIEMCIWIGKHLLRNTVLRIVTMFGGAYLYQHPDLNGIMASILHLLK